MKETKSALKSLELSLEKIDSFQLGWRIIFATGFFPISVGTYYYAKSVKSYFASFYSNNTSLYSDQLALITHVGFTNLILTGVSICVLAFFGVRKKLQWAWYFILIELLWAGINDALAVWIYQSKGHRLIPFPFYAILIGSLGLYFTYSTVVRNRK